MSTEYFLGGNIEGNAPLQLELDNRAICDKVEKKEEEEKKMTKQRKRYSPEKKVEILREHLKNKVPISQLCEKYGIHPNLFYKWEKQFFEGAINTFANSSKSNRKNSKEEHLKQKIARMQEVITELTQENIILKKKYNGEI